jgi:nucleoid DNA-binding protein
MEVVYPESLAWLEAVIDEMGECLTNGESISFRTFGTFQVRIAKGKIGRNPLEPDKDIIIPSRYSVKFRPSQAIKDELEKLSPPQ